MPTNAKFCILLGKDKDNSWFFNIFVAKRIFVLKNLQGVAMAEAFRSGNLGIMDYYRMQNIQADITMREAIGKPASAPEKKK